MSWVARLDSGVEPERVDNVFTALIDVLLLTHIRIFHADGNSLSLRHG